MLFLRLLRWLNGWVRVSVKGRYPERLVNLCANRGIPVWQVRRRREGIDCRLFARDYRKLHAFRRQGCVHLRVTRKKGLPFLCRRYRRRPGLLIGLALFCAFLTVMPRFVWRVEVRSRGDVDEAAVVSALDELGLRVGVPLARVDGADLRHRLALALPEVSWAAVNDDGAVVTVEVRGVEEKPAVKEGWANLVAAREGQIVALYVQSGSAAVKVGDAVTAGQLLVSGTEVYADGRTVFRRSEGQVLAETERTVTVRLPLTRVESVPCGAPLTRRVVSAFGLTIPLYVGRLEGDYERRVTRKDMIVDGITLPLWTAQATFTPVHRREVTLTPEQADREAAALLDEAVAAELEGVEILSRADQTAVEGDALVLTAVCQCRENVARVVPFSVE